MRKLKSQILKEPQRPPKTSKKNQEASKTPKLQRQHGTPWEAQGRPGGSTEEVV